MSVKYTDAAWNGALALLGGATPKFLRSIYVHTETADRYLQVFDDDATADVTLGTTEPVIVIPLATANNQVQLIFNGMKFSNGIVIAATTTSRGATTGGTVNYTVEVD